jgi:hypothetical protein
LGVADYMLLMHDDAIAEDESAWGHYLAKLEAEGVLRGGSAIGTGQCVCKSGPAPAITTHLTGFVRIEARDIDHAKTMLTGNPVFEAGGTVEIRDLPRDP